MRCTGALTVRKARGRERETAPAGGVPESKGRLRAAALSRSRWSARSLGICCPLGPQSAGLDQPAAGTPWGDRALRAGTGDSPEQLGHSAVVRVDLRYAELRAVRAAGQSDAGGHPSGGQWDQCAIHAVHSGVLTASRSTDRVTAPSRDRRRDTGTLRIGPCSDIRALREQTGDPAPPSQPRLSKGDECCIRAASGSDDDKLPP